MARVAGVLCVPALADISIWVLSVVGGDLAGAIVFETFGAFLAVWLEARTGLCADADAVADFDVLDVFADFDGFADDFVADAAGVFGWPLVCISCCCIYCR